MNNLENFLDKLGLLKLDNLTFEKELGTGGQASVCSYRSTEGKSVAVKFLFGPQDESSLQRFRDEADALKRCSIFKNVLNTIITSLSDVQQIKDLPVYYFLLDVARGISLNEKLKEIPPPWHWRDALSMIERIGWALSQAHMAGLVHRDLHPGNIFCHDSDFNRDKQNGDEHPGIYILDFDVRSDTWANIFGNSITTAHTFRPVGSVTYSSPENLSNPGTVTLASDLWSLGVLLYYLLSGSYPFFKPTLRELMDVTESGEYNIPKVKDASKEEEKFIQEILASLLNPDPNKRLTIGELTKVIYDALYLKSIPLLTADPKLWKLYFSYGGDIWVCPRCLNLVHPFGSRCPSCGGFENDWIYWCSLKRD